MTSLLDSPLPHLRTQVLGPGSEALLQRFFEANPLYFHAVSGEPPQPTDAHDEIHEGLPDGWPFTRQWVIGFVDSTGELAAMVNIVEDLLATGVWHISTFIVETARHGRGDAHTLYQGIESWAKANGARWLRLGVVQGHAAAERFWQKCGYRQLRERRGVVFSKAVRTVRVMCKPVSDGTLDEYLALVERDRPGSEAEAA